MGKWSNAVKNDRRDNPFLTSYAGNPGLENKSLTKVDKGFLAHSCAHMRNEWGVVDIFCRFDLWFEVNWTGSDFTLLPSPSAN